MKVLEQIGHQGDTQWFSINELPKEAKKIEKMFLAASEQSGAVHALCGNYDLYEMKDGFCVDVLDDCTLNHTFKQHIENGTLQKDIELPMKDHRASKIKKGLYFVGIQQRYDPMKKLWKKVTD